MSKWFTSYKVKNTLLSIEWKVGGGGYLHVGRVNWTFMHVIKRRGQAFLGTEEMFWFRLQLAIDKEPRVTWFTLEMINPYEARLIFLWMKIWKGFNIRFGFNFGWTLTRASRDYLARQALEYERRRITEVKKVQGQLKEVY